MNNVDILERLEYFEPDDLVECVMYRECIEDVKNLITQNKELKDSGVELATTIDVLQTDLKELKEEKKAAYKLGYRNGCNDTSKFNDKEYILKSKVEEKIEDILNSENSEGIEKLIELQSLLGKE